MMKDKDIVKLIERISSAKNVTEALATKSKEFADYLYEVLSDNGETSMLNGDIQKGSSYTSVGSAYWLRYKGVDINTAELGDGSEDYMYYGQYNAFYTKPTRAIIMEFIGRAEEILTELSSWSTPVDTTLLSSVFIKGE